MVSQVNHFINEALTPFLFCICAAISLSCNFLFCTWTVIWFQVPHYYKVQALCSQNQLRVVIQMTKNIFIMYWLTMGSSNPDQWNPISTPLAFVSCRNVLEVHNLAFEYLSWCSNQLIESLSIWFEFWYKLFSISVGFLMTTEKVDFEVLWRKEICIMIIYNWILGMQ